MHRDVERGGRHQFLVIHVAGVHPRRRADLSSTGKKELCTSNSSKTGTRFTVLQRERAVMGVLSTKDRLLFT
jgi:hypothetical protein